MTFTLPYFAITCLTCFQASNIPGSSDCDNAGHDSVHVAPSPSPRRIPINDHVPHPPGIVPPVVVTSPEDNEVEQPPPIPSRKQVVLTPEQTELFGCVPPPSSRSKGISSSGFSSSGFSSSGSLDVPSFSPTIFSGWDVELWGLYARFYLFKFIYFSPLKLVRYIR